MKQPRRQFIKNLSLASAGIAFGPFIYKMNAANYSSDQLLSNCNATTIDYYGVGPFYTADAPKITDGRLWKEGDEGTILRLSGHAHDLDCAQNLENVVIDLWHADNLGDYDNEGFKFRGKTTTDSDGFYSFETILPGKYLNGSKYRPSHIHFKVTPPNYPTLNTQLYFEGDTDIAEDAAANIKDGTYNATERIISLSDSVDGVLEGKWDIIIDGENLTVGLDVHIEQGILYNAYPNPFEDKVEIQYSIYKEANISIDVFNVKGQKVAVLKEERLGAEKYTAVWYPDHSISAGTYIVSLQVNGVSVNKMRVLKR